MAEAEGDEQRIQHAEHNSEACEHLYEHGGFPDWVVTTAFYSALHYVEYKLFPRTVPLGSGDVLECQTIDEWYREVNYDYKNKHHALRELVTQTCPIDVSVAYRSLLDASYTSRYNHYRTSPAVANKARKDLGVVAGYCK